MCITLAIEHVRIFSLIADRNCHAPLSMNPSTAAPTPPSRAGTLENAPLAMKPLPALETLLPHAWAKPMPRCRWSFRPKDIRLEKAPLTMFVYRIRKPLRG